MYETREESFRDVFQAKGNLLYSTLVENVVFSLIIKQRSLLYNILFTENTLTLFRIELEGAKEKKLGDNFRKA